MSTELEEFTGWSANGVTPWLKVVVTAGIKGCATCCMSRQVRMAESNSWPMNNKLRTWAAEANVVPMRIPGYWFDEEGANTPTRQARMDKWSLLIQLTISYCIWR